MFAVDKKRRIIYNINEEKILPKAKKDMPTKKTLRNTKGKIIKAAWKLFYDQGYDDTTVDEIVAESGTSKGSFYHYFSGKDELLSSLSYIFDEKYEELKPRLSDEMTSFEKLLFLNQEIFGFIENSIDSKLLAGLLSTQLVTKGERHLLDTNRVYYRLIRRIVSEGQASGDVKAGIPVTDIVKLYAMCERALMYDWCITGGEYSLAKYAKGVLPMLFDGMMKMPEENTVKSL